MLYLRHRHCSVTTDLHFLPSPAPSLSAPNALPSGNRLFSLCACESVSVCLFIYFVHRRNVSRVIPIARISNLSLLLLNSPPSHQSASLFLLLMDFWALSSSGFLWLSVFVNICFCLSWVNTQEWNWILRSWVIGLCLTFWETARPFLIMVVQFHTPSRCSTSLTRFPFSFRHSGGRVEKI